MEWKYDVCISTPQTKKMMTMMMMMAMMMTMMMMNMTRFLTAVGAVGLFNESFTLTVEVMGAKEVGHEDNDDGKDEDVEEDHHDNAIVMFTEIISDRSLASVGDVQELDGQRGSDSVCGEEGLYDMSCFFVKKNKPNQCR